MHVRKRLRPAGRGGVGALGPAEAWAVQAHTRNRTQAAHEQLEERYRVLFEQAADAVLLIDPKSGEILEFNNRTCAMFGYTHEEFRRISLMDLEAAESPAELRRHVRKVLRTGADDFVTRHRRKDGMAIDVLVSVRRITLGGSEYLQTTLRDITLQRRGEEALRESETKFRNLAEQSPNMIFINQGGRVVYVNRRCEEVMGYSLTELLAPGFDFMRLVAPEFHAMTRDYMAMHAQGKEVPTYEYVVLTKAGVRIPAAIATRLIQYAGKPAILGIVTDLSMMKQAEVSLRETARELERQKQAVEAKNAALKEVMAQVEAEKLELRRQVTANVETLVLPVLQRLKAGALESDRRLLDVLESNVRELTSRFGVQLAGSRESLSAREVEVVNMIRSGLSSKEIAQQLKVSLRTVDTFRNRIRKKLGISNRDVNLFAHLQMLR